MLRWASIFSSVSVICSGRFKPPLTSAQAVVACIPTYQVDGCQPISKAQAVKPTHGCRPSPAHLLPSCPALALDQRQAARRGTELMMAAAMPSLSSSNPRVQFWLMLFPADKMEANFFYFMFPIRALGGEGRVSGSKIHDLVLALFHHHLVGHCSPSVLLPWLLWHYISLEYQRSDDNWHKWSEIKIGHFLCTDLKLVIRIKPFCSPSVPKWLNQACVTWLFYSPKASKLFPA